MVGVWMGRKACIVVAIAVAVLTTPSAVLAGGDATRGEGLYTACQDCHGKDGEGNRELNAPSLAGQYDWYLLSQMQNFRSGVRGEHPKDIFGTIMAVPARALTDDQAVEDVVAYIAALEAAQPTRTEPRGDPERGRELYSICGWCHGTKAQGLLKDTPGGFPTPRLTGQHDWYLIRQTEYFKDKVRGANKDDRPGLEMRVKILQLRKGQEVQDIVAYIMTLQ